MQKMCKDCVLSRAICARAQCRAVQVMYPVMVRPEPDIRHATIARFRLAEPAD